jgi:colicin import membrane protein
MISEPRFSVACRALRLALLALSISVASACSVLYPAAAVDAPLPPSGLRLDWPSGSIVTVELATQALSDAQARRAMVEETYLRSQNTCFTQFFVTACNDRGKDLRRIALAEVRAVEVEANYINRRDRADQRDKALAERTAQEQAEAPQRMLDQQAREKAAVLKAADRAKNARSTQETEQRQVGIDRQARQRAFDLKTKQQQASDEAGQVQRATNVSAFEKKQIDAAARQQQVAKHKDAALVEQQRKAAELKAAAEKDEAAAAAAAAAKQ